MAKPGSDMIKSDYYYPIAEGLITDEGFRSIGQQVATRTASPATPRDLQMTKKLQTITVFNTLDHNYCDDLTILYGLVPRAWRVNTVFYDQTSTTYRSGNQEKSD